MVIKMIKERCQLDLLTEGFVLDDPFHWVGNFTWNEVMDEWEVKTRGRKYRHFFFFF